VNIRLLLFFLNTSLWAQAQYPGGYAHFSNLTKAQNISGSYWTDINQAKDGSIITKPTPGNYVRIANYHNQTIYVGNTLRDINLYNVYGYDKQGEIFYETTGKFLRLAEDSLQLDTTKPIREWSYRNLLENGALVCGLPGQNFPLQYFDGKKFHSIKTPPPLEGMLADSTVICSDLTTGKAAIGYKDTLGRLWVYLFEEEGKTQKLIGTYQLAGGYNLALVMGVDSIVVLSSDKGSLVVKNKKGIPEKGFYEFLLLGSYGIPHVLVRENNYFIRDIPTRGYKPIPIFTESRPQSVLNDRFYNSYYVGNATEVMRIFPHVIQYPKIFNSRNSNSINTLAQAGDGTIYAGSYSTGLASISKTGIHSIPTTMKFLNGGNCLGNNLFFFSEVPSSFFKYSTANGFQNLWYDYSTGFMLTPTRDGKSILAGLAGISSFAFLEKNALSNGGIKMEKIGPEQGVGLVNLLTFAEDRHGRIFFGRNSEGWGVYDTSTRKAITFTMQKEQTAFGVLSSLCDNNGMIWMGGSKGLWVIDARKKNNITSASAIHIEHPLLRDGHTIGSMKQWGKYLVLGAGRNLLLLDLKAYNASKEIRIRYLNPQETNFTADCEQNTMLIDNRDSSLWMATMDNLYQIDLKIWVKQPAYLVEPALHITIGGKKHTLSHGELLELAPTENSLHIEVAYQSPDNMPRYLQMAFSALGDTLLWSDATTNNSFPFLNQRSGKYTFHLRVLQSDGTITTHSFPITIRRFLWQQWWFWLLISGAIIGVSLSLFYLHKQKQLAEANAARLAAEATALRSEQQRKLTAMQVKSLSTQFRPHFILNALNTIGAQLYDKPEVDAVLGQLGDSIGIIFRNAQAGSIAHPLSQEWRLVESVCSIKQMEFRHSIQIHQDIPLEILAREDFVVPMGILQIPVENALVHGLRNKEEGSKDLWITMQLANEDRIIFTITDNGIGRKAAALISNYRRNGVGSKNLLAIIDLLNQHNTTSIEYTIEDEVMVVEGVKLGTRVIISIPQKFQYDI